MARPGIAGKTVKVGPLFKVRFYIQKLVFHIEVEVDIIALTYYIGISLIIISMKVIK